MSKKTTQSFHSIRRRTMQDFLIPKGFVERGNIYVRHRGNQFHGIDFQVSNFAPKFTINVALHYDYLPGFLCEHAATEDKPYTKFDLLDFLCQDRVGLLDKTLSRDTWWHYDEAPERTREYVLDSASRAIRGLDETSEAWEDPKLFLEWFPPTSIKVEDKIDWAPLGTWDIERFALLYFLTATALASRKDELAKQYVEVGQTAEIADFQKRALVAMIQ